MSWTLTPLPPNLHYAKNQWWVIVYDQNFYGERGGEGMVDGEGGSSEGCLKWGGGGH